MNNKGFISITVIYSFFLVFLSLMALIIVNLSSDRVLLNNIKKTIKNDISDTNMANYLINKDKNLVLKNDSYRYEGENPNNYVCISSEDTCSDTNLFRIIGVIDGKVKLVTNTFLSDLSWDEEPLDDSLSSSDTLSNNWSNSSLNTYLNNDYLNMYLKDYINYIDDTIWYTGGIIKEQNFDDILNNEISNKGSFIKAKIALLYITDYIYASKSNNVANTDNWLYTDNMWFITRVNTNIIDAFYIDENGVLNTSSVDYKKNIKPVFFLKGNVKYKSGDGTKDIPYRVMV